MLGTEGGEGEGIEREREGGMEGRRAKAQAGARLGGKEGRLAQAGASTGWRKLVAAFAYEASLSRPATEQLQNNYRTTTEQPTEQLQNNS